MSPEEKDAKAEAKKTASVRKFVTDVFTSYLDVWGLGSDGDVLLRRGSDGWITAYCGSDEFSQMSAKLSDRIDEGNALSEWLAEAGCAKISKDGLSAIRRSKAKDNLSLEESPERLAVKMADGSEIAFSAIGEGEIDKRKWESVDWSDAKSVGIGADAVEGDAPIKVWLAAGGDLVTEGGEGLPMVLEMHPKLIGVAMKAPKSGDGSAAAPSYRVLRMPIGPGRDDVSRIMIEARSADGLAIARQCFLTVSVY
jgi:hypothetical protein